MTIERLIIYLAIVAGALAGAYFTGRNHQAQADEAAHNAAMLKAVGEARTEEQRRTAKHLEIAHDATKKAEAARADAADAGAARDRLQRQLAAFRRTVNSAAPASSPPAGDPIGVLADVLERSDTRAGILAEYADAARIAGLACERSYDALKPAHKPN